MYQLTHPLIFKVLSFAIYLSILISCSGKSTEDSVVPSSAPARPNIINTIPADGDIDIPNSTSIQFTFNTKMDKQSVESGFDINNSVTGTVSYDETNNTATFNPDSVNTLVGDKTYTVILRNTIKDSAGNFINGNQENGDYSWSFTTLDNISPTIVTRIPDNDSNGIAPISVLSEITVNFSEEIKQDSLINNFTVTPTGATSAITGNFTISGSTVVFKPDNPMRFDTFYTVVITKDVTDLKNNALITNGSQESYVFKTLIMGRPEYVIKFPTDKSVDVPRKPTIKIEFSNPMPEAQFNSNTINITDASGITVPGNYTVIPTGIFTVEFTPTDNLALFGQYQITLSAAITDTAGKSLILKNKGISTFIVTEGSWNKTGSLFVITTLADRGFDMTTDGQGNGLMIWKEASSTVNNIYSKHYTKDIGWDKTGKVVVAGPLNHLLNEPNIELDINGNALLLFHDINLSTAVQTDHIYSIYYADGIWYRPQQLDRATDVSRAARIAMSPSGAAIAVWDYTTGTTQGVMSRFFNVNPTVTVPFGWQALEPVDKTGLFNGTTASGNIKLSTVTMSANDIATAIYTQSNGSVQNLWSNNYPFTTTTPQLVEIGLIGISTEIDYKTNANDDGSISFNYTNDTFWTNTYSSTLLSWSTERQISTITLTATKVNSFRFKNNKELIIFNDNGIIKSSLFTQVNGWETAISISTYAENEFNQVFYNKEINLIVVSWKTPTALVVRSFTPDTGWQNEKTIIEFTNPALYIFARLNVHNDRTINALWYQKRMANGIGDIYMNSLK